ncbi:hypothetical protein SESBI_13216 [Sesbania bispinosa]|nr:hypothetical protein SESBI_13216 [Sesbania bispinosa]
MVNAAMRALRAAQVQVNASPNAGNEEPEIELDLGDGNDNNNDANPPPSPSPRLQPGSSSFDGGSGKRREVWDSNKELENEVNGLKASVELVGKELKSYKTQIENLKTTKEKAEKSNTGLKTELKKLREDLAVRTGEVEATKKEADDLRAEMEQMRKAGSSSAGMGKQAVATLIKKNLARHQAK